MRNEPFVSVIMPTWNRAAYLRESILCVLNQSHKNLELIIIDDGSTDDSEAVIRALNDPRIRYHKFPNSGRPSIARNRGLKLVKGEWVAFCDSDDYWLEQKLEKQLRAAAISSSRWICSNAYLDRTQKPYFMNSKSEVLDWKKLIRKNQIICSSTLIQRSLLESHRGFEESAQMNEDYLFWLQLSMDAPIYYLSDCLLHYTTNSSDSVSRSAVKGRKYEVHSVLSIVAKKAFSMGQIAMGSLAAIYSVRMYLREFLERNVKAR